MPDDWPLPPLAAPPGPAAGLAAEADLAGADFAGALELLFEPAPAAALTHKTAIRINADEKHLTIFKNLVILHPSLLLPRIPVTRVTARYSTLLTFPLVKVTFMSL